MDPVLAPFALLFMVTLGIDFGLFSSSDNTPEDAAPVPEGGTPAPGAFDATHYSDVITGTNGDDNLSANEEQALAWFLQDGNDTLDGSSGNDYAEGGAGNDTMNLRDGRDLAYGGTGDDNIDAGIGFDTIFGGMGADSITGNGGNDLLHGDDGDDVLSGGSGADMIYGGAGNDVLYGLSTGLSSVADERVIDGVDSLWGGDGNDRLILGPGDIGTGGTGNDQFAIDHSRTDLTEVSRVNDFTQGDAVEVHYRPQYSVGGAEVLPVITLAQNSDNTGSMVLFNNVAIANIIGGQGLTVGQINLVPLLR